MAKINKITNEGYKKPQDELRFLRLSDAER